MGITTGDLYRRGKGRVIYWRRLEDGRQRNTSLKTANMREAERLRAAHITDYHERQPGTTSVDIPDLDPDGFWRVYEPWAEANKAPGTVRLERDTWESFLRYHRPARLSVLDNRDAEGFKAWFKRNGYTGADVSDATVNKALRTLKAIFNAGRKLGYLRGENPFVGVRMFRIPTTTPKFLSDDEVDRLLSAAAAHSIEMNMLFTLGLCAGLRRMEVAHCRWTWFDFDRKLITVQRGHGFEVKDRANRTMPMHDRIAEVFKPHAQHDGYVFPGGGEWKYRYNPVGHFRAVVKASGVEKCSYQLMRSTFGSRLAQQGVSIYKISKWMGHSTVEITSRYYSGLQDYDAEINKL